VNTLNEQSHAVDKGRSPSMALGRGANNPKKYTTIMSPLFRHQIGNGRMCIVRAAPIFVVFFGETIRMKIACLVMRCKHHNPNSNNVCIFLILCLRPVGMLIVNPLDV
jgi:hypothetical protein